MPTRKVSLTEHFDRFVDESIESGQYLNASEVVRDALRLHESRQREEQLKLQRLREAVDAGFAAIERGEYRDVEADDIERYVGEIGERIAHGKQNARK